MEIQELIARWNSGEGKPYKGQLIDWDAYESDPSNIGCMCAQGQVLMLAGGWRPKKIRNTPQEEADRETAKLLNISRAHAVLLRNINDKADGAPSVVLTDPGKVLGDQWSKLLDFWWALDQFDAGKWMEVDAARAAARAAAWAAAGYAARAAAWEAAWAAAGFAAGFAAWEIQGFAILKEQGKPSLFLPMFGWETPDDIPARPNDYGLGVVPVGSGG